MPIALNGSTGAGMNDMARFYAQVFLHTNMPNVCLNVWTTALLNNTGSSHPRDKTGVNVEGLEHRRQVPDQPNCLIGGNPARVLRTGVNWRL